MTYMQTPITLLRERFNPLYWMRRNALVQWIGTRWGFMASRRFRGRRVYADSFRNLAFFIQPELPQHEAFSRAVRLAKPQVFWDIGANIGLYSWILLAECPHAQTVLFEPDARNLECLRRTVFRMINKPTIVDRALSDKTGSALFYPDPITGATGTLVKGGDGKTFIERHFRATAKPQEVRTITLDDAAHAYNAPDFIKIDVECAELNVLRGGLDLLYRHRPSLALECNYECASEIGDLLTMVGYELFDLATLQPIDTPVFETLAVHRSRPIT
jgi:FkbM family methyltransferase